MSQSVETMLRNAVERLGPVSDSARLDAELLLAHVLDQSRTWLFTWSDHTVASDRVMAFERLLSRREQGEPIAYLLGEREFWSLTLKVTPDTLIPRPDTETLVEAALALPVPEDASVLDLGTGTGAIALALASERPHWQVVASDKVAAAVALATENAHRNGLERVGVLQSDWFENISRGDYHLIVSNPPYVDPMDPHLWQGDVRYEPHSALVAEQQGMADLDYLIRTAPAYLAENGWLLLEHGYDQADAVTRALRERGYRDIVTTNDLAGQPRITRGQAPHS